MAMTFNLFSLIMIVNHSVFVKNKLVTNKLVNNDEFDH